MIAALKILNLKHLYSKWEEKFFLIFVTLLTKICSPEFSSNSKVLFLEFKSNFAALRYYTKLNKDSTAIIYEFG